MTIYSRSAINRIGDIIISWDEVSSEERELAFQVLCDWRALHLVPLNTFRATLRRYVAGIDASGGIVAQRLKRVPTIFDKIKNREQKMQLSRMQDIGGLRAIVQTIAKVREVERKYRRSRTKHHLEKVRDYIVSPKDSGYRGIHLIYRYNSLDRVEYDGLYIEVQLRTRLQHLWATAVETVGFFFQESLKSSKGNENWLDFFKLVSALFAVKEGAEPHVEFQHFTQKELVQMLTKFDKDYRIFAQLKNIQAIKSARRNPKLTGASYWVIETVLNGDTVVKFYSFLESQKDSADLTYRQLEQSPECKSGKKQVVLVSVDSVSKIERAYPNFFGDIAEFVAELQQILAQNERW
ncbi:MAG: RelA/SpoT domain-containing protein [Planctomycetaceae bacterium]|jgi:hypothetical protein|nr:RelA/SpoT domain-containing protein [Planctomycetaceae bacterium]